MSTSDKQTGLASDNYHGVVVVVVVAVVLVVIIVVMLLLLLLSLPLQVSAPACVLRALMIRPHAMATLPSR